MPDNKNVQDNKEHSKVDSNDPNEVAHFQNKFPAIDRNTIVEAIKLFGPGRDAIMNFLKSKQV